MTQAGPGVFYHVYLPVKFSRKLRGSETEIKNIFFSMSSPPQCIANEINIRV